MEHATTKKVLNLNILDHRMKASIVNSRKYFNSVCEHFAAYLVFDPISIVSVILSIVISLGYYMCIWQLCKCLFILTNQVFKSLPVSTLVLFSVIDNPN